MKGFVYSSKQIVSSDELKNLLNQLAIKSSYYFLRSAHAVSGICMKFPEEFPIIEGQMFNIDCELRWKKQKSGYDVLLLSRIEVNLQKMQPVPSNWQICDSNADFYKNETYKNETKFPKGFTFRGVNDEDIKPENIPIGQRYFKDADTAIVHFIALTVKEK